MLRLVPLLLLLAACDEERVSRRMGGACTSSEHCDDYCLPPAPEFPNGLCTRACNVGRDCDEDSACADVGDVGFCLYTCASDADCLFLGSQAGTAWTCKDAESTEDQSVKVCLGDVP